MTEKPPNGTSACEYNITIMEKHRAALPRITEAIYNSTKKPELIAHIDAELIPARREVEEIVERLQDLLFPGFFGRQELDSHYLLYHLGHEVNTIFEQLSLQIARSVRHECRRLHSICSHCTELGQREAIVFLEKIPHLRELLAGDVQATFEGDPAAQSLDEIVFCYPGLKAITVHRVAHELFRQQIPLIPRMMSEYIHSTSGIDIHPGAQIGRNFFIDHGTGIVIGETTQIGNNVSIYQGVTLGALNFPKDAGGQIIRGAKRHPTIEDNVTIYAAATILGGDTVIGHDSIIGGNVWLTHSIPPNTRVLINEPHLILKEKNI